MTINGQATRAHSAVEVEWEGEDEAKVVQSGLYLHVSFCVSGENMLGSHLDSGHGPSVQVW
jgi:hypothetical protein